MIGNKKILSVITARAGSVGLPGKNYRIFNNKPLFEWSFLAALKSEYIDHVFVSSNCDKVKEFCDKITREYAGRRLIFVDRPDDLSLPTSKNEDALLHAVEFFEQNYNYSPDYIINLQPTSPIRYNRLIDNCIECMYNNNCDSLLTVDKHTPFFWKKTNNGIKCFYDVLNRPMRQDIKEYDYMLHDNGNIYMMSLDTLIERMCRIGNNPFLYETDKWQSLQIDSEEDFLIAECVAKIIGKII